MGDSEKTAVHAKDLVGMQRYCILEFFLTAPRLSMFHAFISSEFPFCD